MDFVVEYKDCCGCGACLAACPKNAISMKTDECGYMCASIDSGLCVDCGKCRNVCPAINNNFETDFEKKSYAGTSLDESTKKSASGGIFALFAKKILSEGGKVFGTEMNENFDVQVVGITGEEELHKLQGSKYVQSNMLLAFKQIKDAIKENKVLFCGTPCQVSALKNYIGDKRENLILIDLVCHGVPSNQMFKDEIAMLQNKYNNRLYSFKFRDKNYGQTSTGCLIFKNGDSKKLVSSDSLFYTLFYSKDIFRESCYTCKYKNINRPGDITICDYWGVQKEEPEFYKECNDRKIVGISGIIINTQKGENLFEQSKEKLFFKESTIEKIQKANPNLVQPSEKGQNYDMVKSIYKEKGWTGVSKFYRRKYKVNSLARKVYNLCPNFVKKLVKKVLGK